MKYCCNEFKRWYKSKGVLYAKDYESPDPSWNSQGYFIDYGNVDYLWVDYCPFCGSKLND